MKQLIAGVLPLFFIMINPLFSQNRSIRFIEKPWQEIVYMARDQNKIIFLDAYTSWCGPCKWMAANMFTNDSIADLYNSEFICVHFDMEKGEGPKLAVDFGVRAYPTLLFIDGNAEVVHKRVGAPQKVSDYIEMARVALTPGEGFAAMQKKYEQGNRDAAFMFKYIDRVQGAYLPINDLVNDYFSSLDEGSLVLPENWKILYQFVNDMNSTAFIAFQKNQEKFEKQYTSDSVNQKLFNVYLQSLAMMPRNRNFSEAAYNAAKQQVRESGYKDSAKVLFTADLYVYQMRGQVDKFLEIAFNGVEKYYAGDAGFLNQMATSVLQMSENKMYLEKASDWALVAIKLKKTSGNFDTYAQLQFKLGNRDKAVENGKMAIELAIKEKVASGQFESNLKRYQQN